VNIYEKMLKVNITLIFPIVSYILNKWVLKKKRNFTLLRLHIIKRLYANIHIYIKRSESRVYEIIDFI